MLAALRSLGARVERLVLGAPEETLSALITQVVYRRHKTNWLLHYTRTFVNFQALVLFKTSPRQEASLHSCLLRVCRVLHHGTVFHVLLPVVSTTNKGRLHSPQLPDKQRIKILVEEYFAHVHPLRCFGFVHKPSFMQRLDEDMESCCNNESLLHIVCALGAK
jgi:hypothetical protein